MITEHPSPNVSELRLVGDLSKNHQARNSAHAFQLVDQVRDLIFSGTDTNQAVKQELNRAKSRLSQDVDALKMISLAILEPIAEVLPDDPAQITQEEKDTVAEAIRVAKTLGLVSHKTSDHPSDADRLKIKLTAVLDAITQEYGIVKTFDDLTPKGRSRRKFLVGAAGAGVAGIATAVGLNQTPTGRRVESPESIKNPSPPPTPQPPSPTVEPPPSLILPTSTPTYPPKPTPTLRHFPAPSAEKQPLAPKSERILYPKELTYEQVKKWLGKMNKHVAVLTESLFMTELAAVSEDQRNQLLDKIVEGHADAIIWHFRDTHALIGLDPGHGGEEIGASATSQERILHEKDINWKVANMVAEKIYQKTVGKYTAVILRPENPTDEDINKDGKIAPSERLQKRVALLYEIEEKLRPNPSDRGSNLGIISIHFNGSNDRSQKGTEVYYPNSVGVKDKERLESCAQLADILFMQIFNSLSELSWFRSRIHYRGVKKDPDTRQPPQDINIQQGPWVMLSDDKLNRDLTS